MKHWSLFVLAYLLNGDMAAGSDLAANCVTTHVLPVITTTMCSGSSPAVPTAYMPDGEAPVPNVPGRYSQAAMAPSAAEPSSVPDISMLDKPMHNPTAQNSDNPATGSDALKFGVDHTTGDAHTAESGNSSQVTKPHQTTAGGVSPNSGAGNSSAPNPHISGQSGTVIVHLSSATKPTDSALESSNTPLVVSGASTTCIDIRVDMMIMTGLVACLAPMMIHL
ncbi:unnamed protein product [Fusarium graminearum]|nr:unnamed protein product [Fusarium graminearum]